MLVLNAILIKNKSTLLVKVICQFNIYIIEIHTYLNSEITIYQFECQNNYV